ncbi:MAG: radical SAM protein [Terracidiphilus sp.]|nr:radical SAM protein [Terracidiphilus sp.]
MHLAPEHALNQCNPFLPSLRSLRLSLTDKCNLRCVYCMSTEGVPHQTHDTLLNFETLVPIVDWLVHHAAIRRIRLTGGEPLLRKASCSAVRMTAVLDSVPVKIQAWLQQTYVLPGALDPERVPVLSCNIMGWDPVRAAAELKRRCDIVCRSGLYCA